MNKIIIVDDSSISRITLEKILIINFSDKYEIVAICEDANSVRKRLNPINQTSFFLTSK
jgi:DNA-binding LytR/AlgR family response regulator